MQIYKSLKRKSIYEVSYFKKGELCQKNAFIVN